MTIVYNQSPNKVIWNVPDDDDDMERGPYRGKTLKRDRYNPRYWIVDHIRFTSFQKAIEWLDQQYPNEPQHPVAEPKKTESNW